MIVTLVGAMASSVDATALDYVGTSSAEWLPAPEARLDDMRKRGDLEAQRMHGWNLLKSITNSSGTSPFLTWYGAGEVFDASPEERSIRGHLGPWSLPAIQDVNKEASVLAPLITRAHYNLPAYRHIRRNQLQFGRRLAAMEGEVPAFPRDSTVVKSVWWPVPEHGAVALPVWDPDINEPRRGGNPYTSWARAVGVTQEIAHAEQADVSLMSKVYWGVGVVNIKAFCNVILDKPLAAKINADPEARRLAVILLGRPLRAGDALVLVAMHIATREMTDWVWSTLWWHDRSEAGVFATLRPSSVRGPWQHYLMSVAFDRELPREADGGPHVAFNPWLEGRFADQGGGNGTVSNCMSCHSRATTGRTEPFRVTRGNTALASPSRERAVRTSSLWSVALQPGGPKESGTRP